MLNIGNVRIHFDNVLSVQRINGGEVKIARQKKKKRKKGGGGE